MSGAMISKVGRSDPALIAYAMKSYGHTNLSEVEWKKVEDHFKVFQDMFQTASGVSSSLNNVLNKIKKYLL